MTPHSSFGAGRLLVATLLLSLAAFSIAVATVQEEVEPLSDPVPQVTKPTSEPPSEPALAEQPSPQLEEIPPPELSDPGESSAGPAIEPLLGEEQRGAVASSLRIEGLGDSPPGQTQAADAAAAFAAAVDHQWWWYQRTWGRKPNAFTPRYELLWAALRESPRGLESSSLAIRAAPRPGSNPARGNGITFTLRSRIPVTVEVCFGFGEWDFVLAIQEGAVPTEIWNAYRESRGAK